MEQKCPINRTSRIVISLIITFIICICGGIGYFGYASYKSLQPIENAEIKVHLAPVVEVGDQVLIEIEIINISDESITLNTINIGAEFVEGLQIGDSTPIFEYRDHFDVLGTPLDIFIFNELILVGDSLTVVFKSEAVKQGDFTGQMIVCLDDTTNCEMLVLRTVIE